MDELSRLLTQVQPYMKNLPQRTEEEWEQEKVDWMNSTPGRLTGYDCPICLNRGMIHFRKNGYTFARECECMKTRRSLRRMARSGLGDMLERCSFDAFQTPEPWQKAAKDRAMAYAADPGGHWFVAAGAVGSGKSHLCTAICKALLDAGMELRYMLWRDEGSRLKAAVHDEDRYRELIEPLKQAGVLYIDDFFKSGGGGVTTGDINLAFELLNYRYNDRKLLTIVSSEKTLEDILDIDQAVGSRLYERSRGFYLRITGEGKNWRLRA